MLPRLASCVLLLTLICEAFAEEKCVEYRVGKDLIFGSYAELQAHIGQSYSSGPEVVVLPDGAVSLRDQITHKETKKVRFAEPVTQAGQYNGFVHGVTRDGTIYLHIVKSGRSMKIGRQSELVGHAMSPDQRFVTFTPEPGKLRVLDLENASDRVLVLPKSMTPKPRPTPSSAVHEPSGVPTPSYSGSASSDGLTVSFITKTRMVLRRPGEPFYTLDLPLKATSRPVEMKVDSVLKESSYFYQIGEGKDQAWVFSYPYTYNSMNSTPDPEQLLMRVVDPGSGKILKTLRVGNNPQTSGNGILWWDEERKSWLAWSKSEGESVLPLKKKYAYPRFSKDRRYLLARNGGLSPDSKGGLEIQDMKTGEVITAKSLGITEEPHSWVSMNSYDDEHVVVERSRYGSGQVARLEMWVYDLKTRKLSPPLQVGAYTSRSNGFGPKGQFHLGTYAGSEYQGIVPSLEGLCVDVDRVRLAPAICATCKGSPQVSGPLAAREMKELDRINQKVLCEEPFDSKQWEALAPTEVKGEISESQAWMYWSRFQKPGGFVSQKHLPILLPLLKSTLVKKDPQGVRAILQNVAHESDGVFRKLVSDQPELLDLDFAQGAERLCRSVKDLEALSAAAEMHLRISLATEGSRTKLHQWKDLRVFTPLLAKLPEGKREEYIDKIAQSMADSAADTPDFNGIFVSKLYKFTYQAVGPLFGQPQKPLTDLTLLRQRDQVVPVILGNQKVSGQRIVRTTNTDYGFEMLALPSIKVPQSNVKNPVFYDETLSWKVGDAAFSAKVKLTQEIVGKPLVTNQKGPRYDQAWADQTMTGVIVTGANMGGLTEGVLDDYKQYYMDNGFEFPDPPHLEAVPLHGFLKDGVTKGEFDYFIKEAHSDGDEKNLFLINKNAMVETGKRHFTDPVTRQKRVEVVHLVFPDAAKPGTQHISNGEFGEWIRTRESGAATKNGEFTYFNTSCWSKTKAVHEIEAAASSTLLNIPATTSVLVFQNTSTNAEFQLLSAYREGKDFAGMRKALENNPGYQGRRENLFIFPDEEAYQREISNILAFPINMKLQIKDSKGNAYSLDQVH